MLKDKYPFKMLEKILISHKEFAPIPDIMQRTKWEQISDQVKDSFTTKAEQYKSFTWTMLTAKQYMDYTFNGNRSKYQNMYFERRNVLKILSIAECFENKGRFIQNIANGIWCICEESTWVIPAHLNHTPDAGMLSLPDLKKPFIDLFSAETGALLAWVYYLLKTSLDKMSPQICERIEYEVNRRIIIPYLSTNKFWWMGIEKVNHINNWTPWCTSNVLAVLLLIERDMDKRVQGIQKALASLDVFISQYHEDGGCDEGTSYWVRAGGTLFDCLELLENATNGKINIYNEKIIKNIGRYIYRTHIHKDYFVNFADGSAKVPVPNVLVYNYGKRIRDNALMNQGIYGYHQGNKKVDEDSFFHMFRMLKSIFTCDEINGLHMNCCPPLISEFWFEGIQVMVAREHHGKNNGFFLAAKGGHNDENHNHNDVGNFIIYLDGNPVIIDLGVGEYTAKTFSPKRYEIWTMQSSYHNLPTVNGFQQSNGHVFKAADAEYTTNDSMAQLKLNIAGAYPAKAGIVKWERTVKLNRDSMSEIILLDKYVLKEPTDKIMFSFITPNEPVIKAEKQYVIYLNGKKAKIIYDGVNLSAAYERIDIRDKKLMHIWGTSVYRIILTSTKTTYEGKFKFIFKFAF
jgi:hypothetical protein